MRVDIGHTQGNLVHIELTQQHGPGSLQLFNRRRILLGDILRKEFRAGRGTHTLRVIQVFQRQRHAVQRAKRAAFQRLAALRFGLRLAGALQSRLRRQRDEAVQAPIQPFDALQVRLGQFERRYAPLAHCGCGLD